MSYRKSIFLSGPRSLVKLKGLHFFLLSPFKSQINKNIKQRIARADSWKPVWTSIYLFLFMLRCFWQNNFCGSLHLSAMKVRPPPPRIFLKVITIILQHFCWKQIWHEQWIKESAAGRVLDVSLRSGQICEDGQDEDSESQRKEPSRPDLWLWKHNGHEKRLENNTT